MNSIILRSVLLVSMLGSCVTLKAHEESAHKSVLARTPFDLDCDDEVKSVRIGDITELNASISRMAIGVTCGGKRASYLVTCSADLGKVKCTPELNSTRSQD